MRDNYRDRGRAAKYVRAKNTCVSECKLNSSSCFSVDSGKFTQEEHN